jgi:hypothetical protein
VVEVEPERLGRELVDGLLARPDVAGPHSRHPVHAGRVDAVEVDRVRMLRRVHEPDPQPLPLACAQRRPRHAPVVGPGRVLHPRRDLDLLLVGHELPLAHAPADDPVVEVTQHRLRVEAVRRVVHRADRAEVSRRARVPAVRLGGDRLRSGERARDERNAAEKVSAGQHQV